MALNYFKNLDKNQKIAFSVCGLVVGGYVSYQLYKRFTTPKVEEQPVIDTQKKPRKIKENTRKCKGVLIAGPPGSGKGAQCERIVKRLGFAHISTGDLLRHEVKIGSDIGRAAREFMDKGLLVPDSIVIDLVKKKISAPEVKVSGWLLDGFPRTLEQAKALKEQGISPDKLIILDVKKEVSEVRIVWRRLDPIDNKIYHLRFDPPPNEEVSHIV
jgi:adenylate kinase